MTSIAAVKLAARRGKHKDARYLIRKLLNTKPTAEAYYIAAELEDKPESALIYVNKALALKPNYEAAVLFKQVLERMMPSETAQLRDAVLHDMKTAEILAAQSTTPIKRLAHTIRGNRSA